MRYFRHSIQARKVLSCGVTEEGLNTKTPYSEDSYSVVAGASYVSFANRLMVYSHCPLRVVSVHSF